MTPNREAEVRRRGPRGAYGKTAARREAILDAALEVFGEAGYRAGSLREVAARVGMTEAGLLHHFPSKGALLTAVLEHRDERSRMAEHDPDDGPAALLRFLDRARRNSAEPGVLELFCRLAAEATVPDHPAHGFFVRRYAELRALLLRAFTDLERQGLLAPGVRPQSAVVSTIAVWDGLQLQWLLDRGALDIPDELRSHLTRLTTVPL